MAVTSLFIDMVEILHFPNQLCFVIFKVQSCFSRDKEEPRGHAPTCEQAAPPACGPHSEFWPQLHC